MRLPTMHGLIERRLLLNYHVDPDALARQLPAPFEPKLYRGRGLVGICLIRLSGVRPRGLPSRLGVRSENAAHRAAVEWTDASRVQREGVYIRRRDTSSRLNAWVGGRLFPGEHHLARFDVRETDDAFALDMHSRDGETSLGVRARRTSAWPTDSVFETLAAASKFFAAGSLGYSATKDPATLHGLELRCDRWPAEPLDVESVWSSYFDDESIFPRGSIVFDHGLLMRNIVHAWHGRDDLCCPAATVRE